MHTEITKIIEPLELKKLPLSYQFLQPLLLENVYLSNRFIEIRKYQSYSSSTKLPQKPISKIL